MESLIGTCRSKGWNACANQDAWQGYGEILGAEHDGSQRWEIQERKICFAHKVLIRWLDLLEVPVQEPSLWTLESVYMYFPRCKMRL